MDAFGSIMIFSSWVVEKGKQYKSYINKPEVATPRGEAISDIPIGNLEYGHISIKHAISVVSSTIPQKNFQFKYLEGSF